MTKPTFETEWKAMQEAPGKERPRAFVRYAQAVIEAKEAKQLNVEEASCKICGCIFFDELDDVPELNEAINIACDLELPPQHRGTGPASEAKYWAKLKHLITEYAAGRRQGISQRVKLDGEQRNAEGLMTASASGWVFVKHGQAWVEFGVAAMKAEIEQAVRGIATPPTDTDFLAQVQQRTNGMVVDGYTLVARVVDHRKGDGHSEFHSPNAFCGYAGEEEMKHFRYLIDQLTDTELKQLTIAVSIRHGSENESERTRQDYENIIDEADRESFYQEYGKIVTLKRVKQKD